MEASPSRSNDSFSLGGRWPRCNPRSSFERLDVVDAAAAAAALGESFSSSTTASFIGMDPEEELFSMRWTTSEDDAGFHFGLPRVIFSDDSLLLPCEGGARDVAVVGVSSSYADASSACSSPALFHTAHSTPVASSVISSSRRPGGGANKPLLATRRILLRYLRFLVPLCRKARALRRLPVPVPVAGRAFPAARSCRAVAATPARRSTSSGAAAESWCHGGNAGDVDVRDAILHCKKSLLAARTEC